jgi:hypothetical protein
MLAYSHDPKSWGLFEPFDPQRGLVVREPPGQGPGYWAGAPGATFDHDTGDFYLVYRLRRPRDVRGLLAREERAARKRQHRAMRSGA